MNRSRLIPGLVIILVLVFPASAISSCCCIGEFAAHSCAIAPSSSGWGCCDSSPEVESCCTPDTPDAMESSCTCTVGSSMDAVPPADSKDRDVVSIASYRLASADKVPADSSLVDAPDRPPISHNQRQAVLCVWRN